MKSSFEPRQQEFLCRRCRSLGHKLPIRSVSCLGVVPSDDPTRLFSFSLIYIFQGFGKFFARQVGKFVIGNVLYFQFVRSARQPFYKQEIAGSASSRYHNRIFKTAVSMNKDFDIFSVVSFSLACKSSTNFAYLLGRALHCLLRLYWNPKTKFTSHCLNAFCHYIIKSVNHFCPAFSICVESFSWWISRIIFLV